MGYYFDEFEVGRVFKHAIRRTVTETDNVLFSTMTHNPAPLHIDYEYMRTQSEFGRPLVNSFFTLGLIVGISINETTLGTTVANLGIEEARFPNPLFVGDTVHVGNGSDRAAAEPLSADERHPHARASRLQPAGRADRNLPARRADAAQAGVNDSSPPIADAITHDRLAVARNVDWKMHRACVRALVAVTSRRRSRSRTSGTASL